MNLRIDDDMYKQTYTMCKPKRIRLFALIINCIIIAKNGFRGMYMQ